MALRLAGEDVGIQEKIENISYSPGVQDSGDLEGATKTVTATSKQGTADYSTNLTVPAPSDGRLTVQRLGLRLQISIDSFGGTPAATQLGYSVEVNGVERLTGNFTGTGPSYAAVDLISGQFNPGSANTIEIFLWVDQGEAVVSLAQVWLGVGTVSTGQVEVLRFTHKGLVHASYDISRVGTGSLTLRVFRGGLQFHRWLCTKSGTAIYGDSGNTLWLSPSDIRAALYGSVATDINYVNAIEFVARSQT